MTYTVLYVCVCLLATFLHAADGLLAGTTATCDDEGEEVHVPIIAGDPCIKCKCLNGEVVCERNACESATGCHALLYNKPSNSCCDVCKGCRLNDRTFPSGQALPASRDDRCERNYCLAGVITTGRAVCHSLCQHPIPVPGECCPSCAGCKFEEEEYANGQMFKLKRDPCVKCTCKDGSAICEKVVCPVLNCPDHSVVRKEGQCCPVCEGKRKVFDIPNMCLFRGKMYRPGQVVESDECTACTCQSGTLVCQRSACKTPLCSPDEEIAHPTRGDDCCSKCVKKVVLPCLSEGVMRKHATKWMHGCAECICNNGTVQCSRKPCLSSGSSDCPKTHEWKFLNGNCCPTCVERNSVCTVFGDPHYKTFDGEMYDFHGTCRYTLAKDCRDNSFSVAVRNYAQYNTPMAWTKSVTLTTSNGTKVRLFRNGVVRVNKKVVDLPYGQQGVVTISNEGGDVVLESFVDGVKVVWNTESYLEVHVSSVYRRRMCGLCGNYNGVASDDFIGRGNQLHTDASEFAHTWKLDSDDACASQLTARAQPTGPQCQHSFSKWSGAHRECAALKSSAFAQCGEKVHVAPYYKSCITDSCNCPKHRRCACDSVLAYVRACEMAGYVVRYPLTHTCRSGRRKARFRSRTART